MHFQVKIPENGTKNIFREKQTINKVLFLDVKGFTELYELRFWML